MTAITVLSLWYDTVDADDQEFNRDMRTFSILLWVYALEFDNFIFDTYLQERLIRFESSTHSYTCSFT